LGSITRVKKTVTVTDVRLSLAQGSVEGTVDIIQGHSRAERIGRPIYGFDREV
jgi:hypothetical protein